MDLHSQHAERLTRLVLTDACLIKINTGIGRNLMTNHVPPDHFPLSHGVMGKNVFGDFIFVLQYNKNEL